MSMQARMSANDPRLYNPARDVAHNFHEVAKLVAERLEDGVWPELAQLLGREGITLDALGEACGAYCNYIGSAAYHPEWKMEEALAISGFLNCLPAAQVAVLAMYGVCYAGIQFAGVREATVADSGPLHDVAELIAVADRLRHSLRRSWWSRLKYKFMLWRSAAAVWK